MALRPDLDFPSLQQHNGEIDGRWLGGLTNAIVWPDGGQPLDLVGLQGRSTNGTVSRSVNGLGPGMRFGASGNSGLILPNPGVQTQASGLIVCVPTTVDTNWRAFMHRRNSSFGTSGARSGVWILAQTNGVPSVDAWNTAGAGNLSISGGSIAANDVVVLGFAIRGAGQPASLFLNGKRVASGTQGASNLDNLTNVLAVADRHANNDLRRFIGDMHLAVHWNTGLSDGELEELTAEPEHIFAPRRIWVPVTAGGTTYNQTVSGILVPSGTLAQSLRFGANVSGNITPSGTIRKEARVFRLGSLSPAGSTIKQTNKRPVGSLAASGSLTSSTGAEMALAGSITLSGALQQAARYLRSYSSVLTPSGALRKMTLKGLSGSIAIAGQLAKGMFLRLTGSITPSGEVSGFKFTPTISNVISTTLRSIRRFIGRR